MGKGPQQAHEGEPLSVDLPSDERTDIADFLLYHSPVPIQFTPVWRVLQGWFCGCGCCCCGIGHPGVPHGAPPRSAGGGLPTSGGGAPAPAPSISVDLDVLIRQFIVGGSVGVEASFEWQATGAPDLKVDVQVRTNITFPDWTNVLSDQAPVDVGSWPVRGVPGERFHFRAVARDAAGHRGYSRIITIHPTR